MSLQSPNVLPRTIRKASIMMNSKDQKDSSIQVNSIILTQRRKSLIGLSYNELSSMRSQSNSQSQKINKKILDIIQQLQQHLLANLQEDITKQVQDSIVDQQRGSKIIDATKQLIDQLINSEVPEENHLDWVENKFLAIFNQTESVFDEEATIDISERNSYIHLKGRRAQYLLETFSRTFSENHAIFKMFPLSKSESFATLERFNSYIKIHVLPQNRYNEPVTTNEVNSMERLNMFFLLIERIRSSLHTLTTNFKTHTSNLESVYKSITQSEMIQPFFDMKIDLDSTPEETTTSMSMSHKSTISDQNKKNRTPQLAQKKSQPKSRLMHKNTFMEEIEESDELSEDEDKDESNKNHDSQSRSKEPSSDKRDRSDSAEKRKQSIESHHLSIEYLKPGNIPWDLRTIRSEGKIGSGGQGTVFRAFDPTKERQIALKFTNVPRNWEEEGMKETYLQEIRIQSFMTSQEMPQILEVDSQIYIYSDKYGKEQMYLISLMELGVGSLDDFMKICYQESIPITSEDIFSIFFDIIEGLEALHHRVVYAHKDIKPQNIIYSIKDKAWKLADFGCVQKIENSPTSFLQQCQVAGTPSYMSPELYAFYQQRNEAGLVNLIANDFYSLGVTLLKVREFESKFDRAKLQYKMKLTKTQQDNLSRLISILCDDDQINRSGLNLETFIRLFPEEYASHNARRASGAQNYLEQVFKYDENAQENLDLAHKLECAKTYMNVNLREKCLKYFDEVVIDPGFEQLESFEKRNILVDQTQALTFFGEYDRAYEQCMKCLAISSQLNSSGATGREFVIADLKSSGQILFNQAQYDIALTKYLQVLAMYRPDHQLRSFKQDSDASNSESTIELSLEREDETKKQQRFAQSQKLSRFADYQMEVIEQNGTDQIKEPNENNEIPSNDLIKSESVRMKSTSIDKFSKTNNTTPADDPKEFSIELNQDHSLTHEQQKQTKENNRRSAHVILLSGGGNGGGDTSPKSQKLIEVFKSENQLSQLKTNEMSEDVQNDIASILTLIGQALNKLGHYDQALKYFNEALVTMEKNLGKFHTSVAQVLDAVGETLLNYGKYKESFQKFQRSYKIKRSEYGSSSIHLAETVNSMGKVLERLTLYEKSAQHYTKALSIYQKHYGHNHIKTAEITNNLGSVRRSEGDYKQAYTLFKSVLEIMSNHYPSDHIELGKINHDIGNVLRNMEHLEDSLHYFLTAKDIKVKHFGVNHVEVSTTCQYIGIIYRKMEMLSEAQEALEMALPPMVSHYGADHVEVVKLVQEIAVLLQQQGKDHLAREKLDFVLANRLKEFGNAHIKTANTMFHLATIEMDLGNYAKSLDYSQQVLAVRETTFGANHLKVANSHTGISQLHVLMGNYLSGKESYLAAKKIYQLDPNENRSKIQTANLILAKIYVNRLHLNLAQTLLEDDLVPFLKQSSLNQAQAYQLLAQVYAVQRLFSKLSQKLNIKFADTLVVSEESQKKIEENLLKSALETYQKIYGDKHYQFAQLLEQKAWLLYDISLAEISLKIKSDRFPESHIEIIHTKEIICEIKAHATDITESQKQELVKELEKLLKLKANFFNTNTTHISLAKTHLLLYLLTNDNAHISQIVEILDCQPLENDDSKVIS